MPTVKICTPFYTAPTPEYGDSLHDLVNRSYTASQAVVVPEFYQGAYLYAARNALVSGGTWNVNKATEALCMFDHFWFIDADISGFTYDMLVSLIALDKLVVSVGYPDRADPARCVAGDFTSPRADGIRNVPMDSPSRRVHWSGLGCCLIHRKVFMEVQFPWFYPEVLEYIKDGELYREPVGEDISFFRYLYLHTKIRPWLCMDYNLKHGKDSSHG